MCGVSAILCPVVTDLAPIFRMTAIQAHRGPDDFGHMLKPASGGPRFIRTQATQPSESHGRVALGHRRLVVIDTSVNGRQPMSDASGKFWISFNGEIYNYIELRRELVREGALFRTDSDTEVALVAYRHWGTACFARFSGMWGLAIWDDWRGCLVLSRDRFGIKPLHYAIVNGSLFVGSEIKAILEGALFLAPAGCRPREELRRPWRDSGGGGDLL